MYMYIFSVLAAFLGVLHFQFPEKMAAMAAEKKGVPVTPEMIKKTKMTSLFFFVMAGLFAFLGHYMMNG